MNKTARRIAHKILYENTTDGRLSYSDLLKVIEGYKYTVIPFKRYDDNDSMRQLISDLHLEATILTNEAFTYKKAKFRFVFVNSDLSEEDRYKLLCHELGHIVDWNCDNIDAVCSNISREEFANEFSFHLNNPGRILKHILFFKRKKRICITVAAAAVVLGCGAAFVSHTALSGGLKHLIGADTKDGKDVYYITKSGEKYHTANCPTIKNRSNIQEYPLEELKSMGYTPCRLCVGSMESEE